MSIQAMAWAIEQQEVKDPVTRLVLICLANYASADGTNAYPAVARLARDTGLCERAVQYQLQKLKKLMVIKDGNRAMVAAHIKRADRRPACYDILISRGAPHAPGSFTGCTETSNGVHMTTERGAPHAPDPSLKSVREPKRLSTEEVEKEIALRFGRTVADLAHQKRGPKH